MPTRNVHLPDALDGAFTTAAAGEGGRSRVLRHLVERYLAERGETAVVNDEVWRTRGRGEKLTLRLKADELAALDTMSRERGVSRTTWLTAMVRGRLLRRPTLSSGESDAYRLAHRELNRIGVNLNQIARAVNTAVLEGAVLKAELHTIEAARLEIRGLVKELRAAFRGNVDYWASEE